ncbi:MAG: NAD-binding protein [Deltaproteobacteria bacterium]|nr:NAD-binding protein [Deltaproteobacteria bacterium]MBW1815692.1 NAD-binding protein [Deltaproteobacteria bacterium]MBW2284019.1 NAD-binding protein [Deltaproteobacteria bacterium]
MQKRLFYLLAIMFLVVLAGSTGYYVIFGGKPSFLDCVYMTMISLTTVGYGEVVEVTGNVTAQIFTIVLITAGMGVILYGISTLTAIIVEGQLSGIMRRKRMENKIKKLSGHYIVCGGDQTGRHVIRELISNKEQVVLIELEQGQVDRVEELEGLFYIQGDATDDSNLASAGIDRARGIVICLPSDKDNLYVTMTARMLNPDLRIITRMTDAMIEPKLHKAGADAVVSPNFIGGLRIASELIRPTAVSFLDLMLRSSGGVLRIHEAPISSDSQMMGKTIKESRLKENFGILVLGWTEPGSSEIRFNPDSAMTITEGMTLIVMGNMEQIAKVRAKA